jgi:hypothetical protein
MKMSLLEKYKEHKVLKEKKLRENPLYTKKYSLYYITSDAALNIPYEGMQCDWHQVGMLINDTYIIHPIDIIGAEDLFGDYGLWDATEFFKSKEIDKNIMCATPIRAILDKLYYELAIYNNYPKHFDDFNDYMFEDIDKKELNEKLDILASHLTSQQASWLDEWRVKNSI